MSCIAVTALLMLLTSCVSNTVYKVVVPDIDFPIFPLAETIEDNGDGTSSVDNHWLVRIAEYYIRINETELNYKEIKEMYEKENEK